MSIVRTGFIKPVMLVCVKPIAGLVQLGEKCELVLDLGSMYLVKLPNGQETPVRKDAFQMLSEA